MPIKSMSTLCCLILTSTITFAQTDSFPNLKGRFIMAGINGGNTFRVEARENNITGNTNFSNTETHSFQTSLGYGFYYGENKAITFEANTSISYSTYPSTQNWTNGYGLAISKMNLKNVYQNKLLVLANQNLGYSYSYQRNYNKNGSPTSTPNPNFINNRLNYILSVGVLYIPNNRLSYRLNIPLVGIGLSHSKTYLSGSNNYSERTDYNYTTSFFYSLANLQLSILYSPSIIQSKKK